MRNGAWPGFGANDASYVYIYIFIYLYIYILYDISMSIFHVPLFSISKSIKLNLNFPEKNLDEVQVVLLQLGSYATVNLVPPFFSIQQPKMEFGVHNYPP